MCASPARPGGGGGRGVRDCLGGRERGPEAEEERPGSTATQHPTNPSRKNLLSYLLDLGVDGVITDYPHEFRRTLESRGYKLAPMADYQRVKGCLMKYNQYTDDKLPGWGYVPAK